VPTVVLTMLTVNQSNALSEMLDAIGNSRLSRRERLAILGKVIGRVRAGKT
jgi:hypothetical protein